MEPGSARCFNPFRTTDANGDLFGRRSSRPFVIRRESRDDARTTENRVMFQKVHTFYARAAVI
jgi:hypothetical protein